MRAELVSLWVLLGVALAFACGALLRYYYGGAGSSRSSLRLAAVAP